MGLNDKYKELRRIMTTGDEIHDANIGFLYILS